MSCLLPPFVRINLERVPWARHENIHPRPFILRLTPTPMALRSLPSSKYVMEPLMMGIQEVGCERNRREGIAVGKGREGSREMDIKPSEQWARMTTTLVLVKLGGGGGCEPISVFRVGMTESDGTGKRENTIQILAKENSEHRLLLIYTCRHSAI